MKKIIVILGRITFVIFVCLSSYIIGGAILAAAGALGKLANNIFYSDVFIIRTIIMITIGYQFYNKYILNK